MAMTMGIIRVPVRLNHIPASLIQHVIKAWGMRLYPSLIPNYLFFHQLFPDAKSLASYIHAFASFFPLQTKTEAGKQVYYTPPPPPPLLTESTRSLILVRRFSSCPWVRRWSIWRSLEDSSMTTRERHRTCDTQTGREHLTTVLCFTRFLYCMNEC